MDFLFLLFFLFFLFIIFIYIFIYYIYFYFSFSFHFFFFFLPFFPFSSRSNKISLRNLATSHQSLRSPQLQLSAGVRRVKKRSSPTRSSTRKRMHATRLNSRHTERVGKRLSGRALIHACVVVATITMMTMKKHEVKELPRTLMLPKDQSLAISSSSLRKESRLCRNSQTAKKNQKIQTFSKDWLRCGNNCLMNKKFHLTKSPKKTDNAMRKNTKSTKRVAKRRSGKTISLNSAKKKQRKTQIKENRPHLHSRRKEKDVLL